MSIVIEQALVNATKILHEPRDYYKAMNSPDAEKQMKAEQEKLSTLAVARIWIKVNRPKDRLVVSYKQIYKIKQNSEEIIERYKTRLITRDFF